MASKITKSTHEPYNEKLFAPIIKSAKGKYIAVLSDTSTDRDEDFISEEAINNMKLSGYVAGLIDHENKVLNQVCEWTNKQVVDIDGHKALVAEPKFFLSNPNAKIIKGMLDEGAKIGISIGAIVKSYNEIKKDGNISYEFTNLELLEASFVAIPSNTHGRAMAVAKSFKGKKDKKMSELKFTQKDLDSQLFDVKKDFETQVSDLAKKLETKEKAFSELEKSVSEKEDSIKDLEKSKTEVEEKVKGLEKSLEDEKKKSIEKQKFNNQGGDDKKELSEEEVKKNFEDGKLPIMRL